MNPHLADVPGVKLVSIQRPVNMIADEPGQQPTNDRRHQNQDENKNSQRPPTRAPVFSAFLLARMFSRGRTRTTQVIVRGASGSTFSARVFHLALTPVHL
jgi:hypothetical protein